VKNSSRSLFEVDRVDVHAFAKSQLISICNEKPSTATADLPNACTKASKGPGVIDLRPQAARHLGPACWRVERKKSNESLTVAGDAHIMPVIKKAETAE
jgi:hypothetical protein